MKTSLADFLSAFRYSQFDATKIEDYQTLRDLVEQRENELNIPENRMFYLSVGTRVF